MKAIELTSSLASLKRSSSRRVRWRLHRFSIATTLALLITFAIPRTAQTQSDITVPWAPLATDLESAQVTVPVNPLFSSEVLLLRSSLTSYRVGVVKATEFGWTRNTVRAIGKASKAAVAINANFFDEGGKALGLIISRGILNQSIHRGGGTLTGVFAISEGTPVITSREEFRMRAVTEALQAGPRIMSEGRLLGVKDNSYSRRAGICIDHEKRIVIYCVSSGFLGVSIPQIQKLLASPGVGCVDALNLDGGGSAQLYVSGDLAGASSKLDEIHIPGTDPVPTVLALFPIE